MKKYKLRFLPLFEEDLNRIVDYISLQLENLFSYSVLVLYFNNFVSSTGDTAI
jgi:hypothetical protein